MSDQPQTIYARSVWADHLGRFVVCGASATPHDGRFEYVLKSTTDARLADADAMAEALERAALSFNAAHLIVLCDDTPKLEALHEEMSAAYAALEKWRAGK